MKNASVMRPIVSESARPTMVTTTAPMVAPICGIRSQTATATARANGYGRSMISAKTNVDSPASTAIASAPTMYAPTLLRISSVISRTRSRRETGTSW